MQPQTTLSLFDHLISTSQRSTTTATATSIALQPPLEHPSDGPARVHSPAVWRCSGGGPSCRDGRRSSRCSPALAAYGPQRARAATTASCSRRDGTRGGPVSDLRGLYKSTYNVWWTLACSPHSSQGRQTSIPGPRFQSSFHLGSTCSPVLSARSDGLEERTGSPKASRGELHSPAVALERARQS